MFAEWSELQFINYSIAEQFEDGMIGAWQMEDWEIYGPGAGGYSSSGPYGNWQDDIRAWLNNGSILAQDIINWDAAQLQSRNLSTYTRDSANLTKTTNFFLPHDADPVFGASGSSAKYAVGEIVVTAIRANSDQSLSYRFASYDPYTHQQVSWVENITFLDMARANADGNVIRFDLAEGEPPLTQNEVVNIEVIRGVIQETISSLQQLNPSGYFEVEGWGRIRVSELITLLTRADWEIHPSASFPGGLNTLGDVRRNEGDPELRMNRDRLDYLATNTSRLIFHLLHEMSHATRIGWQNRYDPNREAVVDDIAAEVMRQIRSPLPGTYTNSLTNVHYYPNSPKT